MPISVPKYRGNAVRTFVWMEATRDNLGACQWELLYAVTMLWTCSYICSFISSFSPQRKHSIRAPEGWEHKFQMSMQVHLVAREVLFAGSRDGNVKCCSHSQSFLRVFDAPGNFLLWLHESFCTGWLWASDKWLQGLAASNVCLFLLTACQLSSALCMIIWNLHSQVACVIGALLLIIQLAC